MESYRDIMKALGENDIGTREDGIRDIIGRLLRASEHDIVAARWMAGGALLTSDESLLDAGVFPNLESHRSAREAIEEFRRVSGLDGDPTTRENALEARQKLRARLRKFRTFTPVTEQAFLDALEHVLENAAEGIAYDIFSRVYHQGWPREEVARYLRRRPHTVAAFATCAGKLYASRQRLRHIYNTNRRSNDLHVFENAAVETLLEQFAARTPRGFWEDFPSPRATGIDRVHHTTLDINGLHTALLDVNIEAFTMNVAQQIEENIMDWTPDPVMPPPPPPAAAAGDVHMFDSEERTELELGEDIRKLGEELKKAQKDIPKLEKETSKLETRAELLRLEETYATEIRAISASGHTEAEKKSSRMLKLRSAEEQTKTRIANLQEQLRALDTAGGSEFAKIKLRGSIDVAKIQLATLEAETRTERTTPESTTAATRMTREQARIDKVATNLRTATEELATKTAALTTARETVRRVGAGLKEARVTLLRREIDRQSRQLQQLVDEPPVMAKRARLEPVPPVEELPVALVYRHADPVALVYRHADSTPPAPETPVTPAPAPSTPAPAPSTPAPAPSTPAPAPSTPVPSTPAPSTPVPPADLAQVHRHAAPLSQVHRRAEGAVAETVSALRLRSAAFRRTLGCD